MAGRGGDSRVPKLLIQRVGEQQVGSLRLRVSPAEALEGFQVEEWVLKVDGLDQM
eukprot:CAMPEP_0170188146 /NCGR_PEP_ID=MMETSP0040_2-20121228/43593_1 /TAXON_ID=641309 /ORGANISM="Lotharella oceanica, Strain CCMP622" /LENGTH=54 /DNA_ID=CAMNT_0010435357 /DNA_START=394 /DNA_END=558 /DNA_ORIENTATION=+